MRYVHFDVSELAVVRLEEVYYSKFGKAGNKRMLECTARIERETKSNFNLKERSYNDKFSVETLGLKIAYYCNQNGQKI